MPDTAELSASIVDGRYKDSSPLDTVERIKSIIRECGLEVVEHWYESGVPYCYSNRLNIPGTIFHTIGKGLTREFAIASAYGELIERLQVGFIYGPTSLKDGDYALDDAKYELHPYRELLEKDRIWYEKLAKVLFDATGERIAPEQILRQYATDEGLVSVTPYLDLTTSQKVYFPTVLRKRLYGSNGCAAGNTPEEALVQAISEIVERHHKLRVIEEGLSLPLIPDEVLRRYPVSHSIITFVRENGYKVEIKDASLDTGFPVVCAVIIDRRTGRYHTHFGAHPVMEIALERALTESFQGRSIQKITTNEDLSPKTDARFSLNAFYAELRRSSGDKLPSFFVGQTPFTFDPDMGVHTCDNKQILRYCRDHFAAMGHSLLVRDQSCLGFPTFQVIVPGYSECYINRISNRTDDQRYATYAIKTLRDPSKATVPDMLGTLMHLDRNKALDPKFKDIHNYTMLIKLPSQVSEQQQSFLMSAALGYVYHSLGKYRDAARAVDRMLRRYAGEETEYLICLKRYLSLMADGYPKEQIHQILAYFHERDTVQRLSHHPNPLEEFVLHCDNECDETCILRKDCFLKRTNELAAMLDGKMALLDFDAMAGYLRDIIRS